MKDILIIIKCEIEDDTEIQEIENEVYDLETISAFETVEIKELKDNG